MFSLNLIEQARNILGRRRLSSSAVWAGQFGFACPQLGIYDTVWGKNRIVNSGLNHFLNAGLRGEGIVTTFYIAPYAADATPSAGLTAANFNASLTEFTNYSAATRQVWTSDGASTAQQLINDVAPAQFTVGNGLQTTIYGAVLHTSNVKGGATGVIVAGARAPSAFLNLAEGFEVRIKYRITGTSS